MNIFISYRHSEAVAGTANLIHDRMVASFDGAEVFLDSGSLSLGEAFPAALQQHLAACEIFLVLIDPHWLASMDRLRDPADWVRRELEAVLKRRAKHTVRVIPVLLQDAAMPAKRSLPKPLAALADLHATPLRGASLDDDIAALALHIDGMSAQRMILWLQARRRAAVLVMLGLLLLFSASVAALFDKLTLDSQFEAWTLAWAEWITDPEPSDRLVIVAINQDTVLKLKRTKFDSTWRADHAKLIRWLAAADAAVVAFDMYLETADPADPTLLAAAVAASSKPDKPDKPTHVVFGRQSATAPAVLPGSVVGLGLLCLGTKLDWARLAPLVVRRTLPPAAGASGTAAHWQDLPSFAALAVAPQMTVQYLDMANQQVLVHLPNGEPFPLPFSQAERVQVDQACAALALDDLVLQRIVRFTRLDRLRDSARHYRYEDFLGLPGAGGSAPDPARFRDKIVLVGSALEKRDVRSVLRGVATEQRHGYEVQADIINTLLGGVHIRPLARLPQFLIMVAMGLLGLVGRFWPPLGPAPRGSLFAVAVVLAYLLISAGLCTLFGLLLNGVYHLAAFGFAFWVSGVLLRRRGLLNRIKS